MDLAERFQHPPASCRGKPFWAWNGRLDEAELRRQLGVFKQMGLGGAFLHARVGLATPYLSPEWFALVRACADECQKLGLEAWLYDEDRWPSGAAGGLVTKDPRFRQRRLVLKIEDPEKFTPTGDELKTFLAAVGGDMAANLRPLAEDVTICHGDKVLAFYARAADPSPWYNGQTYLDTLSAAAVQRFVEVTHEAYAREVLAHFGPKTVPGIFTDEPNHGWLQLHADGGAAPWTEQLPAIFQQRYGYDLLECLPELFFILEGELFSKVRRDYHDCLSHLFCQHYARQIFEWCAAHGIAFTGHVLEEPTLRSQTAVVGSAMRFYEFQQVPGVDILCAQGLTRPGGCRPEYLTVKQCVSVARQLGRPQVLSELYGCTGWQFTFAEYKAVGDWQAALGVTLRCQHLAFYTMLGEAKRDYPASLSFQSPWWRDYPLVENYFARLNVALGAGSAVRDLAVLHPIESAWGYFHGGESDGLTELDHQFSLLVNLLLEQHYDFDLIDEDLLARHGRADGAALHVGQAAYRAVVVPSMITLRATTLQVLERWHRAGGQVIFVRPTPSRVDAEANPEVKQFAHQCRQTSPVREELVKALRACAGLRRVSLECAPGEEYGNALYQLRHDPASGRTVVFLCHTIQDDSSGPLRVTVPGTGPVAEWDAVTGARYAVTDAVSVSASGAGEEARVTFETVLPGAGSRLFVIGPAGATATLPARPARREVRHQFVAGDRFAITLAEPNAVPLDYAGVRVDGGHWEDAQEVLRADQFVREVLGLPKRGGAMCQPWAQEPAVRPQTAKIGLRFRFLVKDLPAGPCHLVLELPERYHVRLNGHELATGAADGWWIDPAFRRLPLPPRALVAGPNELLLETHYGPDHPGLEAVYLTGEFGVQWRNFVACLVEPPRTLPVGDWGEHGLPCYSGGVTYHCTTELRESLPAGMQALLVLPRWRGVLVRVRVNGAAAGTIAWPPHELDVTAWLRGGHNAIDVEVVASRRNLLGPLHTAELYPRWTGPGEFVLRDDRWTDDYARVPHGLLAAPLLSFRA